MRKKLIWIAPLAILGMLAFAALGGAIVRLLWNWLAPELFGLHRITFWQAIGLLAICRILFGRFGFRGSPRHIGRRWDKMTPEERDRFREGMRSRCGFARQEPAGETAE